MKQIFFITFLMVIFTSCQNKKNKISATFDKDLQIIEFEPQQPEKPEAFITDSTFQLTNTEVVQLQTKRESMLGRFSTLLFKGDYIYTVTADETQPSISVFNTKGDFIKRIEHKGRGPGEYSNVTDVKINQMTGDLEILANNSRKLLIYDSLGNFKKQFKLECSAHSNFQPFKDRYFFYNGLQIWNERDIKNGYAYRLIQTGAQSPNKPVAKFLPFYFDGSDVPESVISLENMSVLPGTADTLILFEAFNDTVYSVTAANVKPRYLMQYKNATGTLAEVLDDESVSNKTDEIRERKLTSINGWLENKEYILIRYNVHSREHKWDYINQVLYNKKKRRPAVFSAGMGMRLVTQIDDFPFILEGDAASFITLNNKGKFVTILQPVYLLGKLKDEQQAGNFSGPMHRFLKKFKLEHIKEGDNPILFSFNITEK